MKDLTPTKTTSSWEPIAANGIEVWLRAEETRSSERYGASAAETAVRP